MTDHTTPIAPELIGTRVGVHFNLHKHLWSVTARLGPARGCVIAYVTDITMADVEFIVLAAGRARSINDGVRAQFTPGRTAPETRSIPLPNSPD